MGGLSYVDCRDYGANPDGENDVSTGLNSAFSDAAEYELPLYIAPGTYRIYAPVNWTSTQRVDVIADNVTFASYGDINTVTYGGVSGSSVMFSRITGLNMTCSSGSATGLILQNIENATIEIGTISNFATGIKFIANDSSLGYSQLQLNVLDCDTAIYCQAIGSGTMNMMDFYNCIITSESGATMINLINALQDCIWSTCTFVASGPSTLIDGVDATNWVFDGCRFQSNADGNMDLGVSKNTSTIKFRSGTLDALWFYDGLIITPPPSNIRILHWPLSTS